ncbi:MAG: hypothetical protein ACP5NZ_04250 [Nanobdellota archaeon]
MIEYVLLITFSVILGIIVYKLLSTYVLQPKIDCPDGVSLLIKEYSYDCDSNMLVLNMSNNGKFDLGGYFIYGTDADDKELATIDLTQQNTRAESRFPGGTVGIKFGSFYDTEKNSLGPNEWETEIYNLTGLNTRIYSLDIVPIRWDTQKKKAMLISCESATLTKEINCD